MPAVSPERIIERLRAGESVAAVVLLGDDSYLRELCRDKIIDACVPEPVRDWALARLSVREAGWDEILGRARTLPMLAQRQVILIDGAESVERLGEESRDKILKALVDYFTSPAAFTLLVFEIAALDHRQKFFKLLNEKVPVVELTIGHESAAALARQMARDLGVEIDGDAAAMLVEIVNSEPARIHVELEKLAVYVQAPAGPGRISSSDVNALVVNARRNTIWQLADMLVNRDRTAALKFFGNLVREGEDPAGMIGALAFRYRKLIEASEFPAHTRGFQVARQLGMNPDAAQAAIDHAHRVPRTLLLAGLDALAEADFQFKSSNPNPRATMEFLIARLTSLAAAPGSRAS